jgi:uncharacterized protein YkwD
MKSLLILLLLLNIVSCNKDEPASDEEILQPIVSETTGGTSGGTTGGTTGGTDGGTTGGTSGGTTGDTTASTKTEQFMKLINDHRISIGVQPLVHDEELADVAIEHSSNMATGITPFGHDGFSERCAEGRAILGGGNLCGENVAMGQKTVQAAYTAWMNSSGHKANIEQPRVTHTGFGFAQSKTGAYYWTQIFIEKK